jgi:hypothetical protein
VALAFTGLFSRVATFSIRRRSSQSSFSKAWSSGQGFLMTF